MRRFFEVEHFPALNRTVWSSSDFHQSSQAPLSFLERPGDELISRSVESEPRIFRDVDIRQETTYPRFAVRDSMRHSEPREGSALDYPFSDRYGYDARRRQGEQRPSDFYTHYALPPELRRIPNGLYFLNHRSYTSLITTLIHFRAKRGTSIKAQN